MITLDYTIINTLNQEKLFFKTFKTVGIETLTNTNVSNLQYSNTRNVFQNSIFQYLNKHSNFFASNLYKGEVVSKDDFEDIVSGEYSLKEDESKDLNNNGRIENIKTKISEIKIPEFFQVPSISEKVILDFFQIPYRPVYESNRIYYNLRVEGLNHNQAMAELDTIYGNPTVSKATFFKVLRGMRVRWNNGINFTDIYNIITLIYIFRFIFLMLRYNVFSALIILVLSYCVCNLWLEQLKQCLIFNEWGLSQNRKLGILIKQSQTKKRDYSSTFNYLFGAKKIFPEYYDPLASFKFRRLMLSTDPITFLINATIGAFNHTIVVDDNGQLADYAIDPFALMIRKVNFKGKLPYKLYYWIFQKILGKILRLCVKAWVSVRKLARYTLLTRVFKKYCPYLIRWHWTYIIITNVVTDPLNYRLMRLQEFRAITLAKRLYIFEFYKMIEKDLTLGYFYLKMDKRIIKMVRNFPAGFADRNIKAIKDEGALIDRWLLAIGEAYTSYYIYGLLHASLNQYFYIPFLTENVEHHVGFRDPTSIYSGGLTAWQDDEPIRDKRLYVKLWYGWFGRGTKNKSVLVLLLLMPINFIKQILLWIFRLLFKKKKKRKRKKKKRRRRKI